MGFVRCGGEGRYGKEFVSTEYVTDPSAEYVLDIAGKRVRAKIHTSAPQTTTTATVGKPAKYRPKVVTSLVS